MTPEAHANVHELAAPVDTTGLARLAEVMRAVQSDAEAVCLDRDAS